MKAVITGFFTEQKKPFESHIDYLQSLNIQTLCLDHYQGKKLIELTDHEIKDILLLLKNKKVKIELIDSGIKPFDMYVQKQYDDAIDEFKYMLRIAEKLKANTLLLELPKINDALQEFEMIKNRMEPFFDAAQKASKKILLKITPGYKTGTYALIFKKMKLNHVSVLFDPVQIMHNNDSTTTAYRYLRGHIGAIKAVDETHQGIPMLMGYGKSDVITIFNKLIRDKFSGLILMDNRFNESLFKEDTKKKGFFSKIFSNEDKKKQKALADLSKKVFPNEETKNVTYDDILLNQIKVIEVIFK